MLRGSDGSKTSVEEMREIRYKHTLLKFSPNITLRGCSKLHKDRSQLYI